MNARPVPHGIVLAAGGSTRMEGPLKQLLPYRGAPFLARSLAALRQARLGGIVVVLGARADEVRRAIDLSSVVTVDNPRWPTGMLSSLQAGVAALPDEAGGALVTLVDLPALLPSTCAAILEAAARDPSRIVLPVHRGRRGHPVFFPRDLFDAILAAGHADGPRGLLREHAARVVEVPVEDPGCVADIDTPADYRNISRSEDRPVAGGERVPPRERCPMIQEFLHPSSVAEAVRLRRQLPASLYFAGGTEINSQVWPCHPRGPVEAAIMLDRLPLREVAAGPEGVTLGAGVTIQELVDRGGPPAMLVAAARLFANRNVRTMATLGGNVAGNGACSNITPALLALEAEVTVADEAGERRLSLAEYFDRHDPAALVLAIHLPAAASSRRWSVRKHCRTANDVSIVAVGLTCGGDAARLERPIVALNGATPRAMRLTALERRLDGQPLPPRDEVDALVESMVDPVGDLRGSAPFKCHLAAVLVSDGLREALGVKG